MKYSKYNIPVKIGDDKVLVFNSFRKSYSLTSSAYWDKNFNLSDASDIEQSIQVQMKKNGFIIDDDVDEFSMALDLKMATRLQTNVYHLTINPTLDCNLCCWYCYESHKTGSSINEDIQTSILRHLELKLEINTFKYLHISFFGGEPFIRYKQVTSILRAVKKFCQEKEIVLQVDFTTNGTIWSSLLSEELKNIISVSFQITLDGSIDQHNKVRCFKGSKKGSYHLILNNINRIFEELPHAYVSIRINFDEFTFEQFKDLKKEFLSFPKNRFRISLHKVWQVDTNKIDYEKVFDFINQLQEHSIDVRFLEFNQGETTCYADKINSVVINFDGCVYKCTARNFNKENKVGVLQGNGEILWDYSVLKQYCFAEVPQMCKRCQLFPVCPGICSQKVIEMGESVPCMLLPPFNISDYILYNYKINQIQNNSHYENEN